MLKMKIKVKSFLCVTLCNPLCPLWLIELFFTAKITKEDTKVHKGLINIARIVLVY